jgi:glycolate oxidase
MSFSGISTEDCAFFQELLGTENVLQSDLSDYGRDYTEDLFYEPEIVLIPSSTEQISKICAYCNQNLIPITTRGAGTGLSGGALPHLGGVVLSMKKFDKIISIDQQNLQATVESGVINEVLQNAVKEMGLFYPPDPASKGSCFIGGNIAHSSGGPRALKYGTTRDYILNLEIVLADGTILWTGADTLKFSTGYNLTQLMIGSEGTLAIVTKAVVKLIAYPPKNILLFCSFTQAHDACHAVAQIFTSGFSPSACEFIEPYALSLSSQFLNINFHQEENIGAYLLIEIDGQDEELIMKECEQISELLYSHQVSEIFLADDHAQKEYYWKLRRTIGEATKHGNIYREEDTVVPRASLATLYDGVKEICARYQLRSVCYGHAGDGNLHVNILKDDHAEEYWQQETKQAIREIFSLCHQLRGTISGEHGIGLVQKEYLDIVYSDAHINIMKGIKASFDKNNILNPGKIFS